MREIVVLVNEAVHGGKNHRKIFRLGSRHHGIHGDFFNRRGSLLWSHLPDDLLWRARRRGQHCLHELRCRRNDRQAVSPVAIEEQVVHLLICVLIVLAGYLDVGAFELLLHLRRMGFLGRERTHQIIDDGGERRCCDGLQFVLARARAIIGVGGQGHHAERRHPAIFRRGLRVV